MLVGGFFDRHHADWSGEDVDWFERFMNEQDVDILAWAIGTAAVPDRWQGEMMRRLQALDYVDYPGLN